ncbi:MAG: archaetidylinositol phosphate synthase [Candidatus Methanomethyliaceae archaeon]|nr:archaetidylinositol phosphate synthase [Candidatus Methanomethyliaceae archaeon]MDW7971287.1 archaetidylinositol phosphate synthase [Nitrososphaerota archaeon]
MLSKLKERISSMVNPIALLLIKIGLSPNHITLIGLLLSILSALFFYLNSLIFGGILILLAGFFDALDGIVARLSNRVTKWGGILDSSIDRYSEMIIISGIIIGNLCDILWGLLSIMGSFMVSYTRARGEAEGIKLSSIGLMERAERMLLLAIFSIIGHPWIGIILLAILSNITAIHRLLYIRSFLKKIERPSQ